MTSPAINLGVVGARVPAHESDPDNATRSAYRRADPSRSYGVGERGRQPHHRQPLAFDRPRRRRERLLPPHGACPGLPHEAVLGAKEAGGHVVGTSPAASLREHVETYRSPFREYDVLIFTGLGPMGRELVNIRSSDIVVVIGGRSGTLGEFAIAYEEGKLVGVLTGTGGITEALAAVTAAFRKDTGAQVIYDSEPTRLVDLVLDRYLSADYHCPCKPDPRSLR